MNYLAAANQYVYGKLMGDATLVGLVGGRVYADVAPESAEWPLVTFQPLAAPVTLANGGNKVLAQITYRIKAIGKGTSFAPIAAVADRFDVCLGQASGSYGGCFAQSILEAEIYLPELVSGVLYRHLGGDYRIDIYQS